MKRKFIRALAAVSAVITLLSGCVDTEYDAMDNALENGDVQGIIDAAEKHLSASPEDKMFMCAAARRCAGAGDISAAQDYYFRCLDIDPTYTGAITGLLSALWDAGMLSGVKENFPTNDEIIFRGRPFSDYESGELRAMTSKPDQISYREPEYIISETDILNGEADESFTMPYGAKSGMSREEILEAIGFTAEQAAHISGVNNLTVDISGDSFSAEAKKSRYPAFSQHPYEDWQLTVKKDDIVLIFNCDAEITKYTVRVLY